MNPYRGRSTGGGSPNRLPHQAPSLEAAAGADAAEDRRRDELLAARRNTHRRLRAKLFFSPRHAAPSVGPGVGVWRAVVEALVVDGRVAERKLIRDLQFGSEPIVVPCSEDRVLVYYGVTDEAPDAVHVVAVMDRGTVEKLLAREAMLLYGERILGRGRLREILRLAREEGLC